MKGFLLSAIVSIIVLTDTLPVVQTGISAQTRSESSKAEVLINPDNKQAISGNVAICYATGARLTQSYDIKRGLINLKDAMLKWTKIDTRLNSPLTLSSPQMKKMPFIYIAFDGGFELTQPEKDNIRDYLLNGGFMVIENINPNLDNNPASSQFENMFRDVLESRGRFAPIPNDHPLFHSFFNFDEPPRGSETNMIEIRSLQGVTIDGRLVAVYSNKRYVVRWNDYTDNEPQLRMGINMLVFSLTQKGGIAVRNFR
ncbi:DUF4159 domain-containing protein [bacterium]|nr:DUF4159 domain-containing protein [bacterium]